MKRLSDLWMILAAGALATCSGPPSSSSPETTETAPANTEADSLNGAPTDMVAERPGYDWPQWRGPRQDGISLETGLLNEWPEGGPPELWRIALGIGYSSVAVVGERAYTMFGDDSGEYVICIDVRDGHTLWKVESAGPFENIYGGGPRATPTVHEGRVYTVGATGAALCLDASSGEKIWGLDVIAEFGGENLEWGLSASFVIVDDKAVVVVNGSDGKSLVALNKDTGKTVWTALDDKAGYSTPLLIELDKKKQIVVMTGVAVVGVALDDGAELWRHPWITDLDANAATPIFHAGQLFISSGYDTGAALFDLAVNDGQVEATLVWETRKMKNLFTTSILIDGFLYGFHNKIFTCVDFATGKTQWSQRGFNQGSVLSADGKLIIYGERGTLALAEVSPVAYTEISSVKLHKANKLWSIPTLSGQRLFVRNHEELICFDLRP